MHAKIRGINKTSYISCISAFYDKASTVLSILPYRKIELRLRQKDHFSLIVEDITIKLIDLILQIRSPVISLFRITTFVTVPIRKQPI